MVVDKLSNGSPFEDLVKTAKLRLLQMHYEANAGHIGGNISCFDSIMVLHHLVMSPEDRFVLSKGHSAGALYTTLWSLGKIGDSDLKTFCKDGTLLPGHPSGAGIPGLMFSTGSLGHGPSLSAGLALASKRAGIKRQIYCLCSDGEWQEGSCWEALIFSVHQGLDNLTILVDQNGLQGFGTTQDVVSYSDLGDRMAAFGANIQKVNGHDHRAVHDALMSRATGRPNVVILDTVKGRGLYFEGDVSSHYLPLSKEQYLAGCREIRGVEN
jgi:transketolase